MKKQFMSLPGFLVLQRMVCAVLVLALVLGSMTGCKPTEDITVSSPPIPSMEPTEQPSADPSLELSEPPAPSVPASDVISLPPSQPTTQPPAQSAPPSNPPAQAAFPEIVLSERSLNVSIFKSHHETRFRKGGRHGRPDAERGIHLSCGEH